MESYQAKVVCTNCNHRQNLVIKKGIAISMLVCPNCGCFGVINDPKHYSDEELKKQQEFIDKIELSISSPDELISLHKGFNISNIKFNLRGICSYNYYINYRRVASTCLGNKKFEDQLEFEKRTGLKVRE
jgi:Fe2+ or Zn2+ uptake regulation protein